MLEARLCQEASGPHIVRLLGAHEQEHPDRPPVLAYEESDTTVLVFLRRRGVLSDDVSLLLGRQLVCGGLRLHTLGIVHRDLKPANLLISFEPQAPCLRLLVADLGSARKLPPLGAEGSAATSATQGLQHARFPMTPRQTTEPYAAPEQAGPAPARS